VSLSSALLQVASVAFCSQPRADYRSEVPLFDPSKSHKRAAVRRLNVSESQQNLSDGVIR
jgi:hypothetical protein